MFKHISLKRQWLFEGMIIITGGIDHNHGEIMNLFKHLQSEECINRGGVPSQY